MATGTGLLPGTELARRGGATCEVTRHDANEWHVVVGPPEVRVRVQVDSCGSWLTLACTDGQRPVVVRRAGWVDLRGSPVAISFDRVGLGPGDSVVIATGGAVDLEALLDLTSAPAARLAAAVDAPGAVVLRVPAFADGLARAVEATGLPAEVFAEPLHPIGSPEADLWNRRPTPPSEARMRLDPTPEAVTAARALLRRLLVSWRMPELLDGDMELLATELLTNAVLHAGTSMTVVVTYDGEAVRFEVHDESGVLPEPEDPALDAERGRGLWLVSVLANRWAVEAHPRGKRIWFELGA